MAAIALKKIFIASFLSLDSYPLEQLLGEFIHTYKSEFKNLLLAIISLKEVGNSQRGLYSSRIFSKQLNQWTSQLSFLNPLSRNFAVVQLTAFRKFSPSMIKRYYFSRIIYPKITYILNFLFVQVFSRV